MFLSIKSLDQPHKLTLQYKPAKTRHLDESQIDIYLTYESSEPISLKRYKQIWEHLIGAKYDTHYVLHKNGEALLNDEFILSGSKEGELEVRSKSTWNIPDRIKSIEAE